MDEELKKMLLENLELNKKIYKNTRYVKNSMMWSQFFGVIKFLIIVVPLVLAFIYLPPLLKDFYQQYKSIMDISSGKTLPSSLTDEKGNLKLDSIDLKKIPGLEKLLK